MKRNTFSKALKHLKSTELDEKIQRLNEAPTNSMSGVYSLNDPGFRLGGVDEYDPEKVFYPDVDGNWPAGIPGTPGADTYTRPAGFWSGGTDWDTIHVSDLSQAYLDVDATGKNTSSLIESDGTVKTPLPPNSRHFILGPLVDGYVPNHGYDDFTNIGYLQKDTRQFVLLASIPGHWDSNLRPSGFTPRQWDGSTITIYNANFTLAMAEWFRDKITSDNYTENVPYFYSGGVPQLPQSPANCPKCPPNMKGGNGAGGAGAGWGSGGNSGQGSKQGNPKKGGPGDANLWGLNSKTGKKEKLSAKDYAAYKAGGGDAAAKKGKSIEDIIAQGKKNLGQYDSGPRKTSTSPSDFKNYSGLDAYLRGTKSDYDAYKAGGGDAAVKAGKTRDQVISQGIKNINTFDPNYIPPSVKNILDRVPSYKNTEWGKNLDRLQNDPVWGPLIDAGLGAISMGVGKGMGAKPTSRGLSTKGLTVGATGVNKSGFDALTKGAPFKPSTKPQIMGQGAYQAPKVGATGGLGGGTGASRYAGTQGSLGGGQQPGGVIGSLTPKGAPRIPIVEPQAKVPAGTFDKGARIVRDIQSGKYPTSAKAQQIQQQLGAAGFPKGQSSIPYSQLPKGPSATSQIAKAATVAGVLGGLSQIQGSTPQSGPGSNQAKIQQAIQNPTIKNLGSANYSAFKAGGGEAALKQQGSSPEALANIINQGKQNISQYGTNQGNQTSSNSLNIGATLAAGALVGGIKINPSWNTQQAANAVGNVKDYTTIIQDPKVGLGKNYTFTDWTPSKEGLKANLLKDGQPVMGADGKPLYMTASGVSKDGTFTSHGKGQQTTGNNLRKIINQVKSMTPATETGGVSITRTKTEKPGQSERTKYTEYQAGSGPKPTSGTPSSFRSLSRGVGRYLKLSHEPHGELISESHRRILREIKQPVKIEEPQIQKLTKYKPNFAGRYTAQNTPDVTASPESDAMVKAKNAAGQTWRTKDKHWSRYESTERMNIVFDNVGHGSQYWDQIVDKNQLKKVVRDREVQEHLNIIAHEKAMLREDPLYESPFRAALQEQETLLADKDPLFKKVKGRLKTVIDYKDKPSKLGYPDAPPPEMVNGFHPEYGQKADYYNALDPHSAEAMPATGNPEIDAKVRRAKTLKKVLGKKI